MSLKFNYGKLLLANQNRAKLYAWSQLYYFTGKLPSSIVNSTSDFELVDPFWLYTQSGKNYHRNDLILGLYNSPEVFQPKVTNYGITNRFLQIQTNPEWANMVFNDDWYSKQRYIKKFVNFIYLIPGIKKVYLVGSSQQEIFSQNSDIDIALECHKYWVLPARMWLKLSLKILGKDVHPLSLDLKLNYWKFLKNRNKIIQVQNKITEYKKTLNFKIDAGLFFETKTQISNYFEHSERNLWIFDMAYLPPFHKTINLSDLNDNSSICFLDTNPNQFVILLWKFLKYLLYLPGILVYPNSLIQYFWLKFRKVETLQLTVRWDFCCFFPRYPLAKYLIKLKS